MATVLAQSSLVTSQVQQYLFTVHFPNLFSVTPFLCVSFSSQPNGTFPACWVGFIRVCVRAFGGRDALLSGSGESRACAMQVICLLRSFCFCQTKFTEPASTKTPYAVAFSSLSETKGGPADDCNAPSATYGVQSMDHTCTSYSTNATW